MQQIVDEKKRKLGRRLRRKIRNGIFFITRRKIYLKNRYIIRHKVSPKIISKVKIIPKTNHKIRLNNHKTRLKNYHKISPEARYKMALKIYRRKRRKARYRYTKTLKFSNRLSKFRYRYCRMFKFPIDKRVRIRKNKQLRRK